MSETKRGRFIAVVVAALVGAGALSWWVVEGMEPSRIDMYEVSPVDGRRAVVAFYDEGLESEQLALIDREAGERVWQRPLPEGDNDFFSSGGLLSDLNVSAARGLVVVHASSREDRVARATAMRLETGEVAWERELPEPGDRAGGGLDIHGDTLVTMDRGMGLRVLDVETGEELWSRVDELDRSYRVHEGHVIIQRLMEATVVLRLRTGEEIGRFESRGAICFTEGALRWIDYGSGSDPDAPHALMSFGLEGAEVTRGPTVASGKGIGSWTRCGTYDGDLIFSGWSSQKSSWAADFMRVDAETGELSWSLGLLGRIDTVVMSAPATFYYLNGPLTRFVPALTMRKEEDALLAKGHVIDLETGELRSEGADMPSERIGSPRIWRVEGTSTWIIQAQDGADNVVAAFDAERGVLTGAVKAKGLAASTMRAPDGVLWMHAFGLFSRTGALGWYAASLADLSLMGAGDGAPLEPAGEWAMGWLGAPE